MKKTILILSMVVLSLASQAQGIYNSNARIVSTTGSYWVVDNGSFVLTSDDATNLAQFANLIITDAASLTLGSASAPAYLTVSGTLTTNSENDGGLKIPSGSSLIESSVAAAEVTFNIAPGEWHLISVPIGSATAGIFWGHYLQTHTESSNAYTDMTDPDLELTPMKGYAVWGDLEDNQVTFVGQLNKGDQTFATTHAGAGWNLVGNPYPSSIDWSLAYAANNDKVDAATYRHVNGTTWASYASGVQTNAATKYIAPGQGFFVGANSGGTVTFTDAMRVHNAGTFYKNTEVVPNLIRLEVSGNGYKDEAVFRFLDEASAEFDGAYDAHKLFGDVPEAPQIYTLGSTELSINSMPETSVVPVGVKAGNSGTFVITATEVNNMQFATLEDTKTGIFTDITQKPYSFTYTSGETANRFKLHFSALSVEDDEQSSLSIYSYQKTVYVNFNNQHTGDIYIYNMAGQLITSRETASGLVNIGINAPGVYIVKVVSEKEITTTKVYIQ
jgi:hypothetical protein